MTCLGPGPSRVTLQPTGVPILDEDGDEIKIKSDDDFKVFINFGNSRVKKLYVTMNQSSIVNQQKDSFSLSANIPKTQSQISDVVVHNGVTCHGCHLSPLQGYRYKCIICPDFDICINCEKSQKIHSHHPIVRFPVPLARENYYSNEYEHIRNNIDGILQMFT